MVQSQLSAYRGSDPIWGFVALVRSELFTGEAAIGLDPRVRLFAVEGHVYFAEREDDAPVATRLVNCGAVTAMQLARGVVQAGGQDSLARLFQRDPTIDRDAVELTVETATESLLATIAQNPVGMPEVFPLRYHAAGLHHWLRGAPPAPEADVVEADVVEADVVEADVEPVVELAAFAAPIVAVESAVPEWPKADEEPLWAVPSDASDLPNISDVVALTQPPVPSLATPATQIMSPTATTNTTELPHLAALNSIQIQPSPPIAPPNDVFQPKLAEPAKPSEASVPIAAQPIAAAPPAMTFDSPLPKLAAGPMSVKDIKDDLKKAAAITDTWNGSANNMATVQIWEMVDDLDHPPKESVQVGGGSDASQRRGRGWRHKKD